MAVSVPVPDIPECELLSFHDSRCMWTCSARWNRAIAGGVNQFVIHGQSYSGNYFETTSPGYTAFLYLFSELFTDKQPSWNSGLGDVLDYISRLQYARQEGEPRVDIAILSKQSPNSAKFLSVYPDNDVRSEGLFISLTYD